MTAAVIAFLVAPSDAKAESEGGSPKLPSRREVFRRQWWPKVRGFLGDCDRLATEKGAFGDVIIQFWPSPKQALKVLPSAQFRGDVERCVIRQLQSFARDLRTHLGDVEDTSGIVALGRARKLLPESRVLLPAWLKAASHDPAERQGARAKLQRLLPKEVVVAVDGCLDVPPTRSFAEAVELWFKDEARAVHASWLGEARLGLFGPEVTGAQVLALDPSSLVLQTFYPRTGIGTKTQAYGPSAPRGTVSVSHRLCLLKLDQAISARTLGEINERGNCWRGSLADILAAPGFEFPTDRRYTIARTADDGNACALDAHGTIVCCGRAKVALPAQRFTHMDASPRSVCGVTGDGKAMCVSFDGGQVARDLAGPITRVSSAENDVCGVRNDGAVSCAKAGNPLTTGGRYREVDAKGSCALADSGALACWAGGPSAPGPFTSLASEPDTSSTAQCALDRDGAPWCWERGKSASPQRVATALRFTAIDVAGQGRCGVTRNGCALECWQGGAPRMFPAACFRDLSLGSPSCALTTDGQVKCWGHPLWDSPEVRGGDIGGSH